MALPRVVLDTNVLMSGLSYPGSKPGRIVSAWRHGELEVVLSHCILDELRRVLPRLRARHGLSDADIADLVDCLAFELKMDPAELRLRNLLKPEQFPYTTKTGWVYDSGDYETTMRLAMEMIDYDGLRAEQREKRERGELMGIGMSFFTEAVGAGPRKDMDILGLGMADGCELRIHPTGKAVVRLDRLPILIRRQSDSENDCCSESTQNALRDRRANRTLSIGQWNLAVFQADLTSRMLTFAEFSASACEPQQYHSSHLLRPD